ncbi:Polypyrimidine tract-binding protein -like protein 3 [Capsicum annuum]|nr:Polypyrimidine tract-binding protein -like protein 3 [Capsicum annuum]
MQDIAAAVNAIQFYSNVQPSIRGRNVYVQFSSHQELTTVEQSSQGRGEEPNRILLVSIHHVLYPITVDVLYQVFPPHGVVEKIVTFQKSAGFQALIQYQLLQTAISARSSLQGRYTYDGCCQLDIQFSNLDELQVKYNNERLRDYTKPNLPAEQKGKSPQVQGYGDSGAMYSVQGSGPRGAIAAAFPSGLPPGISGTNDRCTVLVSDVDPDMGDGFQAELAVHFLKVSRICCSRYSFLKLKITRVDKKGYYYKLEKDVDVLSLISNLKNGDLVNVYVVHQISEPIVVNDDLAVTPPLLLLSNGDVASPFESDRADGMWSHLLITGIKGKYT